MTTEINTFLLNNENGIIIGSYLAIIILAFIVIYLRNVKKAIKSIIIPYITLWIILSSISIGFNKTLLIELITIIPLLILILFSSTLINQTYDSYKKNKSNITKQLLVFFFALFIFIVYNMLFITFSYYIHFIYNPLLVKFFAINLLITWLLVLLAAFYTSKIIYFPENPQLRNIDYFLIFIAGGVFSKVATANNIKVINYDFLGISFTTINILDDKYVLIGFITISGIILLLSTLYPIKMYIRISKIFEEKQIKMDPVTLPRLRLSMYSFFMFFLLNVSIFIEIISTNLYVRLVFYLLYILSLFLLELMLYLSFQTPPSIKRKWRKKYFTQSIS